MKRWTIPTLVAAVILVAVGGAVVAAQGSAPTQPLKRPATMSLDGYEIVHLPNASVPNGQVRSIRCPAGKKVVGGGVNLQGNRPVMVDSNPFSDGSGWSGSGRQDGFDVIGVSVTAICVNP